MELAFFDSWRSSEKPAQVLGRMIRRRDLCSRRVRPPKIVQCNNLAIVKIAVRYVEYEMVLEKIERASGLEGLVMRLSPCLRLERPVRQAVAAQPPRRRRRACRG